MNLQDVTKNQHFIAQVEQRLNSINPLADVKNQKILSFSLDDRESYSIHLDSKKGVKINQTLSINDIFSFEILEQEHSRYNFEKLFYKYEENIKTNTYSLIAKLSQRGTDIKFEILNIFVSKLLNFVRNPYSIKKVLNTFPTLRNVHPTDYVHYNNFQRVINGRKPQQEHLCNQLGITKDEYSDWLTLIFLLLTPLEENKPNLFEQAVKNFYESPNNLIMVLVYTYDDKTCLLSDRGYSLPLPEGKHMAWDFNLHSHGFIRYVFSDIDTLTSKNVPKSLVEHLKSRPKSIKVHYIVNDLKALEQYNKNVVYQCFNKVFNSSVECYGL